MVDVEFAVQFLVLAHAHEHPALTRNAGNIALLRLAAELALVPAAIAGGAALAGQRLGIPGPAAAAVAAAVGLPLAALGRRSEGLVERVNVRLSERAIRLLAAGDEGGALRSNLLGLALPFALSALLVPLAALAAEAVAGALLGAAPALVRPLELAFACLAAFACAAGAKALRARRAPQAFAGAAAAGLVALALAGRLSP